ncbi:hypothetical protein ABZY09_36825 [Streptomyces sp. NPDC002928]|uniref:hypothetical protein n=1 Tax=Streptomyces sp. NPDC002928 TaxID=3154440 RepID=UPI0033B1CC26
MAKSQDGRGRSSPTRHSRLFTTLNAVSGLTTGFFLPLFLFLMVRALEERWPLWCVAPLALGGLVSLVTMFDSMRTNAKHSLVRRLVGRDAREEMKDGQYVLYLRPFAVDDMLFEVDPAGGVNTWTSLAYHFGYGDLGDLYDTWEARLTRLFGRFGTVIAVGRPWESFPPPGARRLYVSRAGDAWQQEVTEAIRRARLVVLVAGIDRDAGGAEGTLWEYTEAVRLLPPSRLVLLVCGEHNGYERFREAATEYFARRAAELRATGAQLPPPPVLPKCPPRRRPSKAASGLPLRGVVRFDTDWTAEFAPLDSTAERGMTQHTRWRATVREQVDPLLSQVERGLPGRAVFPWTSRWHWHVVAAVTLGFGVLLTVVVPGLWDRALLSQKCAFVGGMLSVLGTMAQITAALRGRQRDTAEIRLPNADRESTLTRPSGIERFVTRHTVRWPGRLGIGIWVLQRCHDETGEPLDMATFRKPLWEPRSSRKVWIDTVFHGRMAAGFGMWVTLLKVVEAPTERLLARAAFRLRFLVVLIVSNVVAGFSMRTVRDVLEVTAMHIGLAIWVIVRAERDRRLVLRICRRPRLPQDLNREANVLYLRPRGDDDQPRSLWGGPLESDLSTLFNPAGCFRVVGPPQELTRFTSLWHLPLPPDDWQTTLLAALPPARLVLIPAAGTDPETLWQLTEAVCLLPPARLLLVLPSGAGVEEAYDDFRAAAIKAFTPPPKAAPDRSGVGFCPHMLPTALPGPAAKGHSEPAMRGLIRFTEDWTPVLLSFAPTEPPPGETSHRARLLHLRTQMDHLLTALPPAPGHESDQADRPTQEHRDDGERQESPRIREYDS